MKLPENIALKDFTNRLGLASRVAAMAILVSASIGGIHVADETFDSTVLAGLSSEATATSSLQDNYINSLPDGCQRVAKTLATANLDLAQTTAIFEEASAQCGANANTTAAEVYKLKTTSFDAQVRYRETDFTGHLFGVIGSGVLLVAALAGGIRVGNKLEDIAFKHLYAQRYGTVTPSEPLYTRFNLH